MRQLNLRQLFYQRHQAGVIQIAAAGGLHRRHHLRDGVAGEYAIFDLG
ncbi:MAG TPA: hypothetical protein VGK77_13150 [Candidatus Binatia bacterium]